MPITITVRTEIPIIFHWRLSSWELVPAPRPTESCPEEVEVADGGVTKDRASTDVAAGFEVKVAMVEEPDMAVFIVDVGAVLCFTTPPATMSAGMVVDVEVE